MKKFLSITFALLFVMAVAAQEDTVSSPWTSKGDIALLFSQTSFTNWATGGENSITMNGFFTYQLSYLKGKSKWENYLALGYGQTKTGEQGYRKSEDKIDFLSTYGFEAAENWFYSVNLSYKTQFAPGYNYNDDDSDKGPLKISDFMAPGYLTAGVGMEYTPFDYLSLYLSPATARWIFVLDQELADAGAFGVKKAEFDPFDETVVTDGKKVRSEFGAYFRLLFDKEIMKNVTFISKLELFSNYLEKPQNINVSWDNMLDMKINEWISARFGALVLYDENTPIVINDEGHLGKRTQLKQLLAVGLNFNF